MTKLYLFDFDQTLYAYDFHKRLPALAELTGSTQYHLAKTWWVGGHEEKADSGGYPTVESYLEAWHEVTGTVLTLEKWQTSRKAAMTRSETAVDALRHATSIGTASLLSNNNVLFRTSLPVLAPDVAEILGDHDLVSADLGVTKPDPLIFELAIERFDAAKGDALFLDDNARNVSAAQKFGIRAFHVPSVDHLPDGAAMRAAIDAFAAA
ncbi:MULTISPECIES: HAD-IA family hydrolase [Subtercola]|uniref:HAD family phosphatase n=1 Tax=Subtercola vilae TaxID=2056433 RepID=A0A4T2BS97_9MICO|nr:MULTISPECIES: HAD-IA family hydrolase [Subtercola]MEA9985194.1 HAD-IA family hydrolase [Subtercola sp. RTI3]TIH34535.1 HAD family phosphatase [Subtercola vilae]